MMIFKKQGIHLKSIFYLPLRPNYMIISEKTSAANSNNKDNVLEFVINLGGTKGILSPLLRYWERHEPPFPP